MSVPQQVLYVQAFSAGFSLLGLLSDRQLGPALNSVLSEPQVQGASAAGAACLLGFVSVKSLKLSATTPTLA